MSQEERLNLLIMNLLNTNFIREYGLSRICENITIETLIEGLQRFFSNHHFTRE